MVSTIISVVLFCATAFCVLKSILTARAIMALNDRSTATMASLRDRWFYWTIACVVLGFIGFIVSVVT